MYADVIVDLSVENVDRPYSYRIPSRLSEQIKPGCPVIVPFGNGRRQLGGYVVGIREQVCYDPTKIKDIISIPEKRNDIDSHMIELAWWMKEQFGSTMNDALKCVIPVKKKVRELTVRTLIQNITDEQLISVISDAERKRHVAKVRLYKELLSTHYLEYALVTKKLGVSSAVIEKAVADGIIRIESKTEYRSPGKVTDGDFHKVELNASQRRISELVKGNIISDVRKDYLLHGITGSGKTEVYMDIIESVIEKGQQVIMLIPEIALTYQTVKRFRARFGERISIMNSKLSQGERYDQYTRAKKGETDIVIGPRSALFTPFSRLGLIIMDEEHETGYISEGAPAYSTREVALHRGETEGASVILGSATPSLEAYTLAETGRIELLELNERAGDAALPDICVVDMREELKNRNRSMFSYMLQNRLKECLERGEQAMLFLNRRGYSGFVSCRNCGHVIKCQHCDVSMTLHRDGSMMCHYCGSTAQAISACPKCGSPYIGSFGVGTQKVEEQLQKLFPNARILRMDADTTRTKDGYENILSRFANEEADILVGTQMIVKGHDFPKVTLVGIILADLSLHSPDFRAAERTYQLLSQASGRAGRGNLKGNVVIQTYNPEHYSIVKAAVTDYKGFYEEEYSFRKLMGYPPAASMLSIMSVSDNEISAKLGTEHVVKLIGEGFRIIGPTPAPLVKANDQYRYMVYVKARDYGELVNLKDKLEEKLTERTDDYKISFYFN